jgi:PLP dependent protein
VETLAELPIKNRYEIILDKIAINALKSGRQPEDVQLVVVTKGQSIERIQEVILAGARKLGENYVQEALNKKYYFQSVEGLEWHMIGHIQSRKVLQVCENFCYVHSLDRLKLAEKLSVYSQKVGNPLPVLFECNVSGEESKFGWQAVDEADWSKLIEPFSYISALPSLVVKGIMTMPPYYDDPEKARPIFTKMRRLQEFLSKRITDVSWGVLSMGMSGDYEVAIQEGATIVRIGTAIMGERRR